MLTVLISNGTYNGNGQFYTFLLQHIHTREEEFLELGCVYFCDVSHAAGEASLKVDGEGFNKRAMDKEKLKDKKGSIRHKDKASFCY